MSDRHFDLKSKKAGFREKRRKVFKQRLIVFGIAFFTLAFGLSVLSQTDILKITEVNIKGNEATPESEIKRITEDTINGNYLFLFSRKNAIIYPRNNLRKTLMTEIPRIEKVSIAQKEFSKIDITVSERDTNYLWCGFDASVFGHETINELCYFSDGNGYIFSEAPFFSGTVYFRIYGADERFEGDPVGNRIKRKPEDFKKLIEFKKTLTTLDLDPVGLVIRQNGNSEIILDGKSYPRILFKESSNFDTILHNLGSTLETEPLKSEIKEKYNSLLYLDLRFKNRVFYKFK